MTGRRAADSAFARRGAQRDDAGHEGQASPDHRLTTWRLAKWKRDRRGIVAMLWRRDIIRLVATLAGVVALALTNTPNDVDAVTDLVEWP